MELLAMLTSLTNHFSRLEIENLDNEMKLSVTLKTNNPTVTPLPPVVATPDSPIVRAFANPIPPPPSPQGTVKARVRAWNQKYQKE